MPGDAEWLQPLPIRRITASREVSLPPGEWPMTLRPAAQLVRDGLVPGRATVLVGENGSGKSTVVEAIAMAYGLNAEGGSIHARHQTWTSESALHTALRIERGPGASRWGYFVRAETMHGLFVMDEPEAGLSFSAQLALVGSLASLARRPGTQVIVATHSPIIAALPGATILELDEDGFHGTTWDDLAVVDHHRRFLHGPERYLRHLVD